MSFAALVQHTLVPRAAAPLHLRISLAPYPLESIGHVGFLPELMDASREATSECEADRQGTIRLSERVEAQGGDDDGGAVCSFQPDLESAGMSVA
jgi:hypothetical protein